MEQENKFLEELKVQVNDETEMLCPSDNDILSRMDKENNMYSFDMEDIDRKIRVGSLTKNGEQLFMYRKKIETSKFMEHCAMRSQYYVINKSGDIIGAIPVYINDPNSLSMDYEVRDGFEGNGVGTVALKEILSQVYEAKDFNGQEFTSIKYPEIHETDIKKIELEISEDNFASQKVAEKNGFKRTDARGYTLTLEDYNEQKRSMEI